MGWAPTFTLFGLAGMAAAAVGSLGLPAEGRRVAQPQAAVSRPAIQGSSPWNKLSRQTVLHMLLLCFTHSVIRQAGSRVCPIWWAVSQAARDGRYKWEGCLHQADRHHLLAPAACICSALPASAPSMCPLPPPLPCSWNFFILQSWMPTLLASLGLSHLPTLVRHIVPPCCHLHLHLTPLLACTGERWGWV